MTTHVERLVRMETEVMALKDSFDEHKQETNKKFEEINTKLDDLLALRNKGLGVFWIISTLVGTGIVGAFWQLFNYMFGKQ